MPENTPNLNLIYNNDIYKNRLGQDLLRPEVMGVLANQAHTLGVVDIRNFDDRNIDYNILQFNRQVAVMTITYDGKPIANAKYASSHPDFLNEEALGTVQAEWAIRKVVVPKLSDKVRSFVTEMLDPYPDSDQPPNMVITEHVPDAINIKDAVVENGGLPLKDLEFIFEEVIGPFMTEMFEGLGVGLPDIGRTNIFYHASDDLRRHIENFDVHSLLKKTIFDLDSWIDNFLKYEEFSQQDQKVLMRSALPASGRIWQAPVFRGEARRMLGNQFFGFISEVFLGVSPYAGIHVARFVNATDKNNKLDLDELCVQAFQHPDYGPRLMTMEEFEAYQLKNFIEGRFPGVFDELYDWMQKAGGENPFVHYKNHSEMFTEFKKIIRKSKASKDNKKIGPDIYYQYWKNR